MTDIKVSVIMPVYNAGSYLEKTLETVCGQTLPEIEIICVDDGSTDNSTEIIKKYAQNDDRIILIQQQNQFAGVARNNGFEKARGEYAVFWDSDDFFRTDALEILYNKAKEDEADICLCDAYNYIEKEDKILISDEFVKYGILPEETPFSRNDIPDKIFNMGANVPWNKMFRSDFIREHNIKFQALRQSNDTYFVLMAIFLAEKITYTRERLVYYRKSDEGSITSNSGKSPLCSFEAYALLKKDLEKLPFFNDDNRRSYANRTLRGMLRALHIQKNQEGFDTVWNRLVNGGFEELGLINEPEYFEALWLYEDMQSILSRTGTEHMIYKFNCAKDSKEKFKSRTISLKEKVEKKDAALEKNKQKLAENKEKLENTRQKLTENKEKLTETKQKLTETKEKLTETKQKLADNKEKLENTKQKLTETKEKLEDKKQKLAENKEKLENTRQKLTETKEKLEDKKQKLAENKEKLAENKQELKESKKRIAKLEKELEKKNTQLTNLRRKWYVRLFSKIERILKRIAGK